MEPSRENGARILQALKDFGFSDPDVAAEDFEKERQIIRTGIKPTMIEVFTSIPGVEFAGCHTHRVMVDLRGLIVPFISLDDLKANKKASGRLKDLQDLEELP